MSRTTRSGWGVGRGVRLGLALAALTAAVALGGALGRAANSGAPAVSVANKTAAETLVKQAKDLMEQQKYRDAQAVTERALKFDPTNADAQLLRTILKDKVSESTGGGGGPTTTTGPATASHGVKLLTMEQVSMIRLHELQSDETQLQGSVNRQALVDFWNDVIKKDPTQDLSAEAFNNFLSTKNFGQQVQLIKASNNAKYMEKVQLLTDPRDMMAFKQGIHHFVMLNCATSNCHGGEKAGSFRLAVPTGGMNDQTIYTNFYILSAYSAGGGKMMDRDNPSDSLLLQNGLPKEIAKYPHAGPELHIFADTSAPQFTNIVSWINGLAVPRPNYNIVYDLPHGTATAPATAPAKTTGPLPTRTPAPRPAPPPPPRAPGGY